MKQANTLTDSSRSGTREHHEYLIDHFRVSFHDESRWHCGCREFTASGVCRHTREAAGMREAQKAIGSHVRGGKTGLRDHQSRRG